MSGDSSMNAKATVAANIASAMERHALPDSRFATRCMQRGSMESSILAV